MARSVTSASTAILERRGITSRSHAVRIFLNLLVAVGAILVLFNLAGVSAESVFLGSAFAGIVVGLAAQTVLANVFAGLLIVLADPYRPGERVLRSIRAKLPAVAAARGEARPAHSLNPPGAREGGKAEMGHRVTLIPGDGIGPEVTNAARLVAEATGVAIDWEVVEAGEKAIQASGSPLPDEVLRSVRKNRLALKGPITTPIGSGFRSVNVALRQQLDLFASVRPARAIAGEGTRFPETDLIVVREATEGLYSGVEHWVDRDHSAAETVAVVTRKASDRIIRFAFELARRQHRHRITAVHKANIMKTTGGLFQTAFREIAPHYPDIEADERLIDNMCMQLVKKPEDYDVLVTTNLFGDILSDLCAGLAGGLGVAPGALYGDELAVFEPVHGSAPKYAGQDKADPVAEILCLELLLEHIGEKEAADRVFRAVWETIAEKKVVTYDLALPGYTARPVTPSGCSAMAREIARKVPLVDPSTPLPRPKVGGHQHDPHLEV